MYLFPPFKTGRILRSVRYRARLYLLIFLGPLARLKGGEDSDFHSIYTIIIFYYANRLRFVVK